MKYAIFVLVLAAVGVTMSALSGCDLGDVMRVKTPTAIQQTQGFPASMTLNEAAREYQKVHANTIADLAAWKEDIDRTDSARAMLGQLALTSLNDAGPVVMGAFPVLGPALPILTGLAGLFLRKPGDVSKDVLRKEKEASYNKGLETGREVASS